MTLLNTIKQLFTKKGQTKLIGLFSILVLLWLIFYVIPDIFASLFYTLLGNLILLLTTLLVSMVYSPSYGILLGILFVILYRFGHYSDVKSVEAFDWTPDSTNTFLQIQNTINRNSNFDTSVIQEQASQEEVDYFNSHGMWPWSPEIKELYIEASSKNPYIRSYPLDSMIHARTLYNENAIRQILFYQTNEGRMLVSGIQINSGEPDLSGKGSFGYTSGLNTYAVNPSSKLIKCDPKMNRLKQSQYIGDGGILGEHVYQESPVDYNQLEDLVPGFQFTNGACDPCANLNNNNSQSCSFSLGNLKSSPLSEIMDGPSFAM
jgi:hypothetical protein